MNKIKSTKAKRINKQEIITVVGTNYVDLIVPDFVQKSFEVYCKKDFTKRHFQVSIYENAFATAGIVLIVLGLESYRNRIYSLEKRKISKSVGNDLANIFKKQDKTFPGEDFANLIKEVFILRDVIVHNHIYKVKVFYDKDWEVLGHRQTLVKGYGDKKLDLLSNSRTKKTNLLRLNIQPGKIGFEDLFLVLIVFDMFYAILGKVLKHGYVPFSFWHTVHKGLSNTLSAFITNYFNILPNVRYHKSLSGILKKLRHKYERHMSDTIDCFVNNICFKCGEYGFKKEDNIFKCEKCGYELLFGSTIEDLKK